VEPDYPAAKAGLKVGDRILAVDGKPVVKFGGMTDSVTWRIVRSEGATIPITVERNGKVLELESGYIKETTKAWQRKSLRQIGVEPAYTPIIGLVITNGPAADAGLRRGDEIHAVDGVKLHHPASLGEFITNRPNAIAPITLSVVRDNKPFEVTLTPEIPLNPPEKRPQPMIGIQWDTSGGKMALSYPGVMEQVDASVKAMINTFGALFSRKSDIGAQHLSGAVKIMNIYYVLFKSEQGWRLALWFSVIMNVNLAILNLLPIPVLDGGHIVLALIESVRRKPVSVRILQAVQTACAVIIIAYMVWIAFYDVQELGWKRGAKNTTQFAPQPPANTPPPVTPK
jgi:regulator of sigma E protease